MVEVLPSLALGQGMWCALPRHNRNLSENGNVSANGCDHVSVSENGNESVNVLVPSLFFCTK